MRAEDPSLPRAYGWSRKPGAPFKEAERNAIHRSSGARGCGALPLHQTTFRTCSLKVYRVWPRRSAYDFSDLGSRKCLGFSSRGRIVVERNRTCRDLLPVRSSPFIRFFRATVSLVAVAAWFHASNHCAIGAMLPEPAPTSSDHASCHTQTAPAESEEKGDCADLSCCGSLSAPAVSIAKSILGDDVIFPVEMDFPAGVGFVFESGHDAPIAELDTGPPQRDSFAESVLQRSLLAHAPPVA